MLWVLVALGAAVAILAFVLAPLVRSEGSLDRLHRPRPGVRNIRGPTPEALEKRRQAAVDAEDAVGCPSCGAAVDDQHHYCGDCGQRVR